ncbi:MAG: adenylate/guanylate cyclase domain-containing protein [Rhodoferax sp.]|nr:adenylate/guanylate cyclase domain-containing protein [Rhodoferax sp.]
MTQLWTRLFSKHGVIAVSLGVAALISAAFLFFAAELLNQLELRSSDQIWRIGAVHADERRLIVVDIDERSLQQIGPWPWPHDTQARLIQKLAAAGAREQIIDIVFTDAQPHEASFVAAVQQQQPVLAQVFTLDQGGQPSVGALAGALDWATCPAPFAQSNGYLGNFAALKPDHAGHITPRVGRDGVVRHQPAIICHQGKSYPALGLAALMRGAGERNLTLQRGSQWFGPAWSLRSPNQGMDAVPLEANGDLRVSWHLHPDSFVSVSASDVLADRLPADLLKGAWVLVGASAFGLNDTIATPFEGAAAGLQVHAQIITALLDGRTPFTPLAAPALQAAAALLGLASLVALSLLGRRFPVYLLPLVATGWALLFWSVHAMLLLQQAIWVGWSAPALFILSTGSIMGVLQHAKSRLDRDRLYTHLSSYLPAPVAAALALQPPSSAIKASTKQVSVLFADIRNFSAYCEARPPAEAAAVLHAFFSTAAPIVEAHGGVIEAFQGDAIFAVWNGDPAPDACSPDGKPAPPPAYHAQRALDAAVALLSAVHGLLPDPAPAGLEPLALGIGVETGPAMAGSFGQASRRTHMVMGRTVTIASRLVVMTAELAHPILVGEGLAGQVGAVGLESMGFFMLDGMRAPHHVYAYPLVPEDAPGQSH